ncbi:MAG TPA: hypothetical protein VGO43_16225 [Pyrinomonadaceae bacterium]|jgi:tetratricopeptide (TPR) repeat protein|nr:hypothetical protein [Pyrinomonadaceae bacterium]
MSDLFISREQAEGDLLTAAAFIAERIKSSDGHAEAMNAIVPQYLAAGNVDLAAELANAVDDPFSRDKLLILVAEKCAVLDDDEYALQLADAIEDHGMQAQCFERIALVKANDGDKTRAVEIAQRMEHPDYVFAGIAVNQAAIGKDPEATATIEAIDFPSARVLAWQTIASARIEKGATENAIDALDKASRSARQIEHDEERIRALCDVGNLYIEAHGSEKAIAAFDEAGKFTEVLDNIHRDFLFVRCALGFLHAGSLDLADRTLDLVTDKTQMASALLGFARDQWKKGEKDEAVETLEEGYEIVRSQREIETRDRRSRNALMTSIAAQFAGFGKTDRAVEIALENLDPTETTSALTQIAQILTIQKEDDLVRQTLGRITDDGERAFALIQVADTRSNIGQLEEGAALLGEAVQLVGTVAQKVSRADVLVAIATRFAEGGNAEKARDAALSALRVIIEIRDESAKATSLADLGRLYSGSDWTLNEAERAIVGELVQSADQ